MARRFAGSKLVVATHNRGKAGEILSVNDQGMTIAAGCGAILAKRVRGADGKKVAAAEWATAAGVKAFSG